MIILYVAHNPQVLESNLNEAKANRRLTYWQKEYPDSDLRIEPIIY